MNPNNTSKLNTKLAYAHENSKVGDTCLASIISSFSFVHMCLGRPRTGCRTRRNSATDGVRGRVCEPTASLCWQPRVLVSLGCRQCAYFADTASYQFCITEDKQKSNALQGKGANTARVADRLHGQYHDSVDSLGCLLAICWCWRCLYIFPRSCFINIKELFHSLSRTIAPRLQNQAGRELETKTHHAVSKGPKACLFYIVLASQLSVID